MYKNSVYLIFLLYTISFSNANAENWLLKESPIKGLYAVLPIRTGDDSIGGFEVKNIEIYKNDSIVTGYGFTIMKGGHSFDFDKTSILRYYLRPTGASISTGDSTAQWPCNQRFFEAVVDGQQKRVRSDFPGLSSYYPKGTTYEAKYISTIDVLGKTVIQNKMRPIEVWGFANSKKNAEKMAKYFEMQMIESTYYYFSAIPNGFHGHSQLLNDTVNVDFNARPVITQPDEGNILNTKYRAADFHINLSINGESSSWKQGIRERYSHKSGWYWTDPGWHALNLDGRDVRSYVRSQGRKNDIWVQYKGPLSQNAMDISNVRIPKCE